MKRVVGVMGYISQWAEDDTLRWTVWLVDDSAA